MYTNINFKTKKAFKEYVNDKLGTVSVYEPGGMFPAKPGKACIEGPHYPEPHKWYATCIVDDKLEVVPGTVK